MAAQSAMSRGVAENIAILRYMEMITSDGKTEWRRGGGPL